jgi:ribosomal protein S18 acetylase RimI-like enzyme
MTNVQYKVWTIEEQVVNKSKITDFYKKAGQESNFLSFDSDEYIFNTSDIMIVADCTDYEESAVFNSKYTIAGIATISKNQKRKSCHIGVFGICILKDYQNQGLGSILIEKIIKLSKDHNLYKISLIVRSDNINAIKLYKKYKFQIEGRLLKETLIDNNYYDSLYMGLQLETA